MRHRRTSSRRSLRLAATTASALAWLATAGPAHASVPSIEVIAAANEQAPGFPPGTEHILLNWPVALNDAGELAFHGWIGGPGVPSDDTALLIWTVDAQRQFTLEARGGDPVPGLPGSSYGTFLFFTRPMTWITTDGAPVFLGLFAGGGFDTFGPFGPVEPAPFTALLVGQPAPGAEPALVLSGTVSDLNAAGQVVWTGTLASGVAGVDASNDQGLWGPGAAGNLTLLAREGFQAPGAAVGSLFDAFGPSAVIGDDGGVAFRAELRDGTGDAVAGNREGLWQSDGAGATSLVARAGFQAPGTAAGSLFDAFGPLVVNGLGQVAFRAELRVGTGDVTAANAAALFATNAAGVLELLVRAGEPAPGTAPGSLFEDFFPDGLRLDDLGRVAFHASLGIGTGDVVAGNETGLWLSVPGQPLELVARQGDPVPDLPGETFVQLWQSRPLLSASGDLGFYAQLPGSFRDGYFQRAPGGPLVTVLAPGTSLELSPGVFVPLTSIPAPREQARFSMNASGQRAHVVRSQGTGDVVVVTALPEPRTTWLLAAACALLAVLPRRRTGRAR